MPRLPTDAEREHRITYDIVVDCYDEYEVAAGWYCYLGDRLEFPFAAKWKPSDAVGSLGEPETVQVIGMADAEECKTDILVDIEYREQDVTDVFSVPLAEIEAIESGDDRSQAIGDWQYWLNQGNELIDPDEYEEY